MAATTITQVVPEEEYWDSSMQDLQRLAGHFSHFNAADAELVDGEHVVKFHAAVMLLEQVWENAQANGHIW